MKIIYPGTFNPWTIGHQNVYERACKIFGKVTVVIAINPNKTISPEAIAYTLEPLNMSVEICKDLVALDADIIIRGVRTGDWEYEQELAQWNKILGAETVFLPPEPSISHISSSAIRELIKHGQDVSSYVDKEVFERWGGGF